MPARNLNGWIPDSPDHRDFDALEMLGLKVGKLPRIYDSRPTQPPIYDQGSLGSCVFNAGARLVQFTEKEMVHGSKRPVPSRLFLYYNARVEQGTVNQDSGSSIRMLMKVLAKYGYCYDADWTYDVSKYKSKPPKVAYDHAMKHELGDIMYGRVGQTLDELKTVLADNNPVAFGFTVYDSFMNTGKDGVVKIPSKNESVQGGHAVTLTGYDDVKKWFIVANSWGTRWGDKGYCYMPYDFVLNRGICSDFWTIKALPALDSDA